MIQPSTTFYVFKDEIHAERDNPEKIEEKSLEFLKTPNASSLAGNVDVMQPVGCRIS